jgi:hypothetical protein
MTGKKSQGAKDQLRVIAELWAVLHIPVAYCHCQPTLKQDRTLPSKLVILATHFCPLHFFKSQNPWEFEEESNSLISVTSHGPAFQSRSYHFLFVPFWQYWSLNSGPQGLASKHNAIWVTPHTQPFFSCSYFSDRVSSFCHGLASDCNPLPMPPI